jgi:iron complex outermembrane receptor protein
MSFKDNWLYKGLAIFASSVLLFAASISYSQETIESEEVEADSSDSEKATSSVEEVVVTGSRLKRSTYSSISPLQIITPEISREAGLLSAADILQTSTSAGGQQIDLTFSGFVLDNGPGSRTLSLRGLGAARTLLLINGRRMAPSGAEGAPYAPSLGTIPSGLVGQYDVLTDGASSVYGSDAIGGVTNVILKKDFDGFNINNASMTFPKYDGADTQKLAITWGKNWDRGFVGGGLDYTNNESATYGSRPWMSECRKITKLIPKVTTVVKTSTTVKLMEWKSLTVSQVV